MGNACCGLDDGPDMGPGHTLGSSDSPQQFGMGDDDAREKMRLAAEERHRQNAVRGTQRTTFVKFASSAKVTSF